MIESAGAQHLRDVADEMGFFGITAADDIMLGDHQMFHRHEIEEEFVRPIVVGDEVRDWLTLPRSHVLFPYRQENLIALDEARNLCRWLWPFRTTLGSRPTFSKKTYFEEGRPWWEWHQIAARRANGLAITLAFVATDNHFVLERGGSAYKQSSPLIKLGSKYDETAHQGILGLLNSSAGAFWMKQVLHDKGNGGIGGGIASEDWERFYEYTSAGLAEFVLPKSWPTKVSCELDALAQELKTLLAHPVNFGDKQVSHAKLDSIRHHVSALRRRMIGLQEELDWLCYHLYELLPSQIAAEHLQFDLPIEVELGERAFEIVLARHVAAGRETTTWFERHGSTPVTEIPSHWPEDYRQVVQRRIDLIERDRNIGLIERPEYKRRWNTPAWEDLERAALRAWLLDRLEEPHLWPAIAGRPSLLTTVNRLADAVRTDVGFMQIAGLYAGHADFDLTEVIAALVASESVPFLPVLRYTDTGLRKRSQWEDTWALQRREDAGEKVGKIPVPPKYQSKDFLKADFWRLRGGLDVPKERWVSYPGCERGADASLPIAWAGWNHLQQATALAAYFLEMKENEGWEPARLQPLLAGLLELLPWLEQWHNEIDPVYGERMGTYYRGFVNEEARALGFTLADLRAWKPVASAAKRGRKKAAQPS